MSHAHPAFTIFILGEFEIGTSADSLFTDHALNYVAGKYLTCLNSFIPAGSYILPGGDLNTRIPIMPKVSYLVKGHKILTLRIGKVAWVNPAVVTFSDLDSTPILFAWSDEPIFTNAPAITSSIESFGFAPAQPQFNQVDQISGVISGVDVDIDQTNLLLSIHPLIGTPAYSFHLGLPASKNQDVWSSYQAVGVVPNDGRSLFPVLAQAIAAHQSSGTQRTTDSVVILRSEIPYFLFCKGQGKGTDSDQIAFSITPTNFFPPSRPGNVAFSQTVTLNTTNVRRILLPAGFFCESIIMSADLAPRIADSTLSEQFLLAGGGTVDNLLVTFAAGSNSSVTQINRIISETLELSLAAEVATNTEFVIEFRGQIAG